MPITVLQKTTGIQKSCLTSYENLTLANVSWSIMARPIKSLDSSNLPHNLQGTFLVEQHFSTSVFKLFIKCFFAESFIMNRHKIFLKLWFMLEVSQCEFPVHLSFLSSCLLQFCNIKQGFKSIN